MGEREKNKFENCSEKAAGAPKSQETSVTYNTRRRGDYFVEPKISLETEIRSVQQGDIALRNRILKEYHPFIKSVLSKVLNEFVAEDHEYFTVGLLAFNEAMDRYNMEKGKFLTFSGMVIKSRLIDELRKRKRLEDYEVEGEDRLKVIESPNFEKRMEDQLEIEAFKHRIEAFGFDLETLIDTAPKHRETRKKALEIGKILYKDEALRRTFLKTGNLPAKELQKKAKASRRVLQRSRNFIIAVFFILDSDLEVLKKYLEL